MVPHSPREYSEQASPEPEQEKGNDMAKKKQPKRAAARKVTKKKATKASPAPWATAFTRDFRTFLTNDPKHGKFGPTSWPWPQNQPMSASLADLADIVKYLGESLAAGIAVPLSPGASAFMSQAAARVAAFPWPNSPIYQEKRYAKRVVAIHLYEIVRVADMMLEGIWSRGGGGSRWPPSR
jgi:hypothetical protein